MSHHSPLQQHLHIIFFLFSLLPAFPSLPVLPNPNPNLNPLQTFHPTPSQPVTIPSFPEQSALSGCPLHLPDPLFPAVKSSCTGHHPGQLPDRAQCCPVLASWLYSAYSTTALRTNTNTNTNYNDTESDNELRKTTSLEMPDLPDDSETCVEALENVMREKGVNLVRPNETCDVVYCYCGIRLHPLSCSTAFRVDDKGHILPDSRVHSLERHCLTGNSSDASNTRLARCSKCLHSLYSVAVPLGNHKNLPVSVSLIAGPGCDRFLLDTLKTMYSPLQEQGDDVSVSKSTSNAISQETSANIAKEKGNDAFKNKQWPKAVSFYTDAIKLNGNNATYYSNRAAAYLELGSFVQAEADCTKAINLDKKNVKAYLRRGTAREMRGYYKEAIEDFRYALVLEPTNKRAAASAERLKNLFQ